MMLNVMLQKKVKKLESMGIYEAMSFKDEVIASLLDNPTKFYLYDLIDARVKSLSLQNAIANNTEDVEAEA